MEALLSPVVLQKSSSYSAFSFLDLGDEIVRIIIDFVDISDLSKFHTASIFSRKLYKHIGSQICSIHSGVLTVFHSQRSSNNNISALSPRQPPPAVSGGGGGTSFRFRDWIYSRGLLNTRRIALFFPGSILDEIIRDAINVISKSFGEGNLRSLTELVLRIDDCNESHYASYCSILRRSIRNAASAGCLDQLQVIAIEIESRGISSSSYPHNESFIAHLRRHCPRLKRLDGFSTFSLQDCLEFLDCPHGAYDEGDDAKWMSLETIDLHGLIRQISELTSYPQPAMPIFDGVDGALRDGVIASERAAVNELFAAPHDEVYVLTAKFVLSRLTPQTFPSLKAIELANMEGTEVLALFEALLYTRQTVTGSSASTVTRKEFIGNQIETLSLDLISTNAHDHFEYSQLWADLMKIFNVPEVGFASNSAIMHLQLLASSSSSGRGLVTDGLFPTLRKLSCNNWLPCSQFLGLVLGTRRSRNMRANARGSSSTTGGGEGMQQQLEMEVCPGVEDPCFSSFLVNKWDPLAMPLTSLILRRRQYVPYSAAARYFFDPDQGLTPSVRSSPSDRRYNNSSKRWYEEFDEGGEDLFDLNRFEDEYAQDINPMHVAGGDVHMSLSQLLILSADARETFNYHPAVSRALCRTILAGKCAQLLELSVLEDFLRFLSCDQRYPATHWEAEEVLDRVETATASVAALFDELKSLRKFTVCFEDPRRKHTSRERKESVEKSSLVLLCGIRRSYSAAALYAAAASPAAISSSIAEASRNPSSVLSALSSNCSRSRLEGDGSSVGEGGWNAERCPPVVILDIPCRELTHTIRTRFLSILSLSRTPTAPPLFSSSNPQEVVDHGTGAGATASCGILHQSNQQTAAAAGVSGGSGGESLTADSSILNKNTNIILRNDLKLGGGGGGGGGGGSRGNNTDDDSEESMYNYNHDGIASYDDDQQAMLPPSSTDTPSALPAMRVQIRSGSRRCHTVQWEKKIRNTYWLGGTQEGGEAAASSSF